MTYREPLLAEIFAAPDDNVPRLVYADWCFERGETERAEAIWAGIREAHPKSDGGFSCNRNEWPLDFDVPHSIRLEEDDVQSEGSPRGAWSATYGPIKLVFHRGFVCAARGPLAELLKVLPEVLARHPLTSAWVTDAEPQVYQLPVRRLFAWERSIQTNHRDMIPPGIFDRLRGGRLVNRHGRWERCYYSRESAFDSLGAAVICQARDRLGRDPSPRPSRSPLRRRRRGQPR